MIPPCLTLSNIRYISRVKWSNPGKGVASTPTPQCSSYWKGNLLVATFTYYIYIYIYLLCSCLRGHNYHIYQPLCSAGYDTRSIFKWSLTGLNSELSFSLTSCLTKAEEPSQPYYLPIAGGRIIGFIPFPTVSVLCEKQSVSSKGSQQ